MRGGLPQLVAGRAADHTASRRRSSATWRRAIGTSAPSAITSTAVPLSRGRTSTARRRLTTKRAVHAHGSRARAQRSSRSPSRAAQQEAPVVARPPARSRRAPAGRGSTRGRSAASRRRAGRRPAARRRRRRPPRGALHARDRLVQSRARHRLDAGSRAPRSSNALDRAVVVAPTRTRAPAARSKRRSTRASSSPSRPGMRTSRKSRVVRLARRARRSASCARRRRVAPRPTAGEASSMRTRSSSAGRSSSTASSAAAPHAARTPARNFGSVMTHGGTRAASTRPRARSSGPNVDCSRAVHVARARCPGRRPRARAARAPGRSPRRRRAPAARRRRRGRAPRISTGPPPGRDSTPWRTAFSTSGCSDSTGTTAVQHLGVDLHAHLQPVAEARLLEPQVLLDVVQLVGQRHVGAVAAERVADELGELGQQLARLLRPRVDERWRPPPARCR